MLSKNKINKLIVFLAIGISISVFQLRYLDTGNFNYIRFIFLALIEIISIPYIFKIKGPFTFPVLLISIAITLSMFMAYMYWDQEFIDSLKATVPLMLWLFFYYLSNTKLPIKTVERIITFYGITYIILYFFQFINSSVSYFGFSEELTDETRGIVRIIFPGGGLFFLMIFIAITKLTNKTNENFGFWLIISLFGLIIPVMQVTRQLIAVVIIIYVIHFIKIKKIWIKVVGILTIITVSIIFIKSDNSIIKGLKESQKSDFEKGEEYIRVLAAKYFLYDFSPNVACQFFGNGTPYGDKSNYGKFNINNLRNIKLFYFEDIGLIGVYALFGVLAIIGFIIIWIKSFMIKLPSDYYYLKYYLWFLLLTSFTSDFIYKPNYLISNIIVLFLYNKISINYLANNTNKKIYIN